MGPGPRASDEWTARSGRRRWAPGQRALTAARTPTTRTPRRPPPSCAHACVPRARERPPHPNLHGARARAHPGRGPRPPGARRPARPPAPRLRSDVVPNQRRLAEIIEMIHTASLVHDDVLDEASLRRGARGASALGGLGVGALAPLGAARPPFTGGRALMGDRRG